ncbi:hypothetical protein DFH29DRAFT_932487 [Suillus ampliporus]|nr:hypothetical protein DFH29DRAFT_932487 [Suillus ampliporus]
MGRSKSLASKLILPICFKLGYSGLLVALTSSMSASTWQICLTRRTDRLGEACLGVGVCLSPDDASDGHTRWHTRIVQIIVLSFPCGMRSKFPVSGSDILLTSRA